MKLRRLQSADFMQVAQIEQMNAISPWTLAAFQNCEQPPFYSWVLVEENTIIGFIMVFFAAEECHILNLSVHPDFKRQGLGKKLLNHALTWAEAQQAQRIFLEVRRSNLAAINLYQKFNFVQIGERKGYYATIEGREDALCFSLNWQSSLQQCVSQHEK